MTLAEDFEDFVKLLNLHKVEYMVVGGYALAFHGKPRHTGDLDIWIKPSFDNADKMVKVLEDFGFGSLGLTKEDFLRDNYVTQLGYPPLRIDILNAISGVNFDDAYKGRILGQNGELAISFINISDFIANKKASGRAKDIGDINALNKPKKK